MQAEKSKKYGMRNRIGLVLGPFLFILFAFFIDLDPANKQISIMAGISLLMGTWWISESIPIPATALLPLALYPLLGVMKGKEVAPVYANSSIFLFMGGFFIALTIEKWNLHKRLALNIIKVIGDNPKRVVLGFMAATAFLSMWISNTATSIMMLPIAISIIKQTDELSEDKEFVGNFSLALMLSICYSASIGGVGTLIGTPPNISFVRIFALTFPEAPEISFFTWFIVGIPLVCVFLFVAWFMLVHFIAPLTSEGFLKSSETVGTELKKLGRISKEEVMVLVVFLLTALLWIFRKDIDIGTFHLHGWSRIIGGKYVDDGTVAMAMALLLFAIPVNLKKNQFLLDWETAVKVPWGILLLFGGGFALAKGFKVTGLAEWIGMHFADFKDTPVIVLIASVCFLITFLTELTSNTATTEMILPILASIAVTIGKNPLLLMIPATISASFAFMLPVATPPNAIIFGSGYVPIEKMAKAGIFLNLIGIVLVVLITYFVAIPIFDISLQGLPEWAR